MQRENCRICGRWGSDDPARTCRQVQDISGEYYCPGDGPVDEDAEGFFVYYTVEEMRAQEAHFEQIVSTLSDGELG